MLYDTKPLLHLRDLYEHFVALDLRDGRLRAASRLDVMLGIGAIATYALDGDIVAGCFMTLPARGTTLPKTPALVGAISAYGATVENTVLPAGIFVAPAYEGGGVSKALQAERIRYLRDAGTPFSIALSYDTDEIYSWTLHMASKEHTEFRMYKLPIQSDKGEDLFLTDYREGAST